MKERLLGLYVLQGVGKMEINKITIGGFRNINKLQLEFDSITALVGTNGYGKSNAMDAIDFGFDYIHSNDAGRTSMMAAKSCIPIIKTIAGQDYYFGLEAKLDSQGKRYCIDYSFSFSWHTQNSPARILKETLKIKLDDKNQKFNLFISRNENVAKYRSSPTGRCDKTIKIDSSGLVLNKLASFDDLYYNDIVKQVNTTPYYLERHLDASPSFTPAPFVFKGFKELELPGIQSIPRAIYFLKKDYADKYELLVNTFKQLFPNIKEIDIEEIKLNQPRMVSFAEDAPVMFTDSVYSMSIIDEKMCQPLGFENLSDGTKRIFLMLTYAIIADIKGLSMIAVEEPENSIHPALFQEYIDVLSQLVSNCKIVFTSHSPYLIQYLNPHSIYIGMPVESGEVDFRRIAKTKVNALLRDAELYDKSIGDYIFNILSSADSEIYLADYVESNG